MWNLLASALGIFDKIFGYVADTKKAQIAADAQVETASIVGMAGVEQKWSFVAALLPLYACAFLPWLYKAAVWDKVIGPAFGYVSTTDPLTGALAWTLNIVVSGIFLHTWINRT